MLIESKFVPEGHTEDEAEVWGITHYGYPKAYEVGLPDSSTRLILLVHCLDNYEGGQVLATEPDEDDPQGQLNIERLSEDNIIGAVTHKEPFEIEVTNKHKQKGRLVFRSIGSTPN